MTRTIGMVNQCQLDSRDRLVTGQLSIHYNNKIERNKPHCVLTLVEEPRTPVICCLS